MDPRCPHCGAENLSVARFCARCGHAIAAGPNTVGRAAHPSPEAVADGYRKCDRSADLYFRTESAWGGSRLLATENLGLVLLNAGYPLKEAVLRIEGLNGSGQALYEVEHTVEQLPRGKETTVEIPSYEMTEPANDIRVSLVSAEYEA